MADIERDEGARPAPDPIRVDVGRYFAMVEEGLFAPDDRVELLEGVIVSMPSQSPLHASGIMCAERRLRERLPPALSIRVQMPFLAGGWSVTEPDIAVVAGDESDYMERHPSSALLLVEVAVASVAQDRLTKAPIYAAAGIPDYWIVNHRDECVEVFSDPLPLERRYRAVARLRGEQVVEATSLPDLGLRASELFPRRSH